MDGDRDTNGFETNSFDETSYQVTDNIAIPIYADVQRYPCPICSRCFNAESLRKHQPICKNSSQKQPRKIFDMGKQRATDSDVPYGATRETTKFYHEGIKPKSDHLKKSKNNWREDHQTLVQTIRQAKQVTQSVEIQSTKMPKQSAPSSASTDYIQCEFCQRLFNQYSAERHIPFCETQFKRKQLQSTGNAVRSPVGNLVRQGRLRHSTQQSHQINSAPSTFTSKNSSNPNGRSFRKPLTNPTMLRRTQTNGMIKSTMNNGTPQKFRSFRANKIQSSTNHSLSGTMRTGRTSENDDLNVMAAAEREIQPKSNNSPRVQQRVTRISTESSSPRVNHSPTHNEISDTEIQSELVVGSSNVAKHCHQCGEPFVIDRAKFCCECGQKRFGVN